MKAIGTFFVKFANDWAMNLAGMLTYSLITAIFSLLLGIFSIAGLVLNALSPSSFHSLAKSINNALPPETRKVIQVDALLNHVIQVSGPLAIVALIGLLWTGSNLFTNVENAFSIVFRTRDRDFIPQRVMAIGMVLILAILLPASLFAATLVTVGSDTFKAILPAPLGGLLTYVGPLTSLAILWLLFLAIYKIVPNMDVPFRDAWRGALVAAVLFGIFDVLFPLYFKVFLAGNDKFGATAAGALVVIIWLWFFNVILMIGAEINSVAMGIKPLQYDLARTIAEDYQSKRTQAAAQRKRRPLPQPSSVAKAGRAAGTGFVRMGRLLAPPLRLLALLGWALARPVVRAEEKNRRV